MTSELTSSRPSVKKGTHLLVVIDHREARIYSTELHGAVPQRITPYSPQGVDRHLHYVQNDSNGQRKPEQKSFYQAVAKTLQGAQQILMFGAGTGASSAMEQLFMELERRHPQVARRIVGRVVVDEQHLTEDQLLAKARDFYANLAETGKAASRIAPQPTSGRDSILHRRGESAKKYVTQSEAVRALAAQQTHGDLHAGPGVISLPAHEDIARRAYDIYVKAGRKQGQCKQNWHEAEHELRTGGRRT